VILGAHLGLCVALVCDYRAVQLEQYQIVAGVVWASAAVGVVAAVALYGWNTRSWSSLLLASVGWIGASVGALLLANGLGYIDSEAEGTGGELFLLPLVLLLVGGVVKRARRRQAPNTSESSSASFDR
jgi:hypothetical protein